MNIGSKNKWMDRGVDEYRMKEWVDVLMMDNWMLDERMDECCGE